MSFKRDAADTGKFSLLVVLALVIVVGSIAVLSAFGNRFIGKFNEETRYQIQQESQAYRDGLRRNLSQMHSQHASANASGKAAIMAAVKQQYGQLEKSHVEQLPQYLQDFLRTAGVY